MTQQLQHRQTVLEPPKAPATKLDIDFTWKQASGPEKTGRR